MSMGDALAILGLAGDSSNSAGNDNLGKRLIIKDRGVLGSPWQWQLGGGSDLEPDRQVGS